MLDRLQARWSPWLPRNLTLILIVGWALSFILGNSNPDLLLNMTLDFDKVREGEVWRVFSFFLIAPTMDFLWLLIACYVNWLIGSSLESHWGPLRYLLYLLLSWLGMLVGVLMIYAVGAPGAVAGSVAHPSLALVPTLLFAFATVFPNIQFLLFFVLPVKVKWLGMVSAALLVFHWTQQPLIIKLAMIMFFVNYFVFFVPFWYRFARGKRRKMVVVVQEKRREQTPFHVCHVCGITEKEAPDRQFRVDIVDGEPKDICEVCLAQRKA